MVKKRKEDFANFVSHTLQNSMLTGIPQIAQARNNAKRIIRSLVFCFCIVGFIYQSYSFMSIYWEYDVVMDVQVTTPFFTEPPAITFCHRRGVMQDEACRDNASEPLREKYNLFCDSVEYIMGMIEGFSCECNPRLCDDEGNPQDWMWLEPPARVNMVPYEDIEPWLLHGRQIIGVCNMFNLQTRRDGEYRKFCHFPEYIKHIPCANDGSRESCATLFSTYGEPNKTWPEIAIGTELNIQVPLYEKYMEEEGQRNDLYVSIHDPRTVVNPFKDGFVLKDQNIYTVKVDKVEKQLLPPPYKTNCMDYRSMWESRGGKGPLDFKECLLEAQVNSSLALYGCVLKDIYFIGEGPRCPSQYGDEIRKLKVYTDANPYAEKYCKPACEESYYTLSSVTSAGENRVAACGRKAIPGAVLKVVLDGMEITKYSYSPKYQDVETFSYVGGYVGMWLGISLVAVFDFLETVFLMMQFPLRRFQKFRNKKKIQNQIIQIHGNLHH